ncbi:hypothetical protein J0910_30230 [Nocardiopsis sp. CNT-189]|uniref:hypothetical protein n=1 Tax=Nocardiopsis oceanisediminis TaxID=2816862 RepID=UPI003B2E9377
MKRPLQGRDTTRARFIMACRTADYPPRPILVLSEAFGACRCVDSAPLSRAEAAALAGGAGVAGEALAGTV